MVNKTSLVVCVFASILVMSHSANAELLLFDDFEYVVDRNNPVLPNQNNNFVTTGPWTGAKAQNITGRGDGYLSTADSIPGYAGSFPGQTSGRVLRMEARNISGGTDFYLQYGGADRPNTTVPGNVWFQWWMYINHYPTGPYGSELSGVESRHKFIYPCDRGDGCWPDSQGLRWLLSLSANPYNTLCYNSIPSICTPFGSPTANGEAFVIIRDMFNGYPNYAPAYPDNHSKLGPNNQPQNSAFIVPNQWQLIKVHFDTSSTQTGGVFEVWIKSLGGEWRKISEWIHGVTPDFTWNNFTPGGHRGFRMPTTIGFTDNPTGGAWYYIDDFAMASTEDSLPVYGPLTAPRLWTQ